MNTNEAFAAIHALSDPLLGSIIQADRFCIFVGGPYDGAFCPVSVGFFRTLNIPDILPGVGDGLIRYHTYKRVEFYCDDPDRNIRYAWYEYHLA